MTAQLLVVCPHRHRGRPLNLDHAHMDTPEPLPDTFERDDEANERRLGRVRVLGHGSRKAKGLAENAWVALQEERPEQVRGVPDLRRPLQETFPMKERTSRALASRRVPRVRARVLKLFDVIGRPTGWRREIAIAQNARTGNHHAMPSKPPS
jgi:hypothetical protein